MNHLHMFEAAKNASQEADYTGSNSVKLGCVIVYKGTILAKGCNSDKTHPMQEQYNKYRFNIMIKYKDNAKLLNFGFFRTNLCRYLFKNAKTIFERLRTEL